MTYVYVDPKMSGDPFTVGFYDPEGKANYTEMTIDERGVPEFAWSAAE
jgi:hypothetical protein